MKQLFLLRHAESAPVDPNLPDFERPLNKNGEKDVPQLAQFLRQQDVSPDLIITSPATRTMTTALIMAEYLGFDKANILPNDKVYEASLNTLLSLARGINDEVNVVMLVGHNPGLSNLAMYLTDDESMKLDCCGVCRLDFDVDTWQALANGLGRCTLYEYPKNIS